MPAPDLPAPVIAPGNRRSDYDVTNTVRVSHMPAVRDAIEALFAATWPGAAFDTLWLACHDFNRLFRGQLDGYVGCDTLYHDQQHSLDVTLAMARLLAGYEQSCDPGDRLGHERAVMGVVCALFHDAGYIRKSGEQQANGAEFTPRHIGRSAAFLGELLPRLGIGEWAPVARQVVHFTGYEIALDQIELDDPRDSLVGHLLGSADLMAQMADRCYLEKCRDRLYGEFVLAGVAVATAPDGSRVVKYASGTDLLRQTLDFWENAARARLDKSFNGAYRYVEPLFGGRNPYLEAIQQNLTYLREILASDDWARLKRKPPVFTVLPRPIESVGALVSRQLAGMMV